MTKTRLANKTIWALEDIMALCRQATGDWEDLLSYGQKGMDPVLLATLARLRHRIAEIERIAKDARQGEYRELP